MLVLSNEFIESAKDSMTLTETRLFFFLLKLVDSRNEKAEREYEIHVMDYARFYGLSRKNLYEFVDQLTDELFKRRFVLPRDDGRKGFQKHGWITDADYQSGRGILTLKLHEKFHPCVLNLSRDFAQVPEEDLQGLQSKYSYWFIFLASKNLKLGRREYEKSHLQAMVGAQGYRNYADFRRRALEVAERELREKASFCFDWKVGEKRGRSPVTIEILSRKNTAVIEARRNMRLSTPPLPLFALEAPSGMSRLVEHGISPEKARKLHESEDPGFLEWVAGRIDERKRNRRKSDPIRDHGRFSLAILEGERANYLAEERLRKDRERKQSEALRRTAPIARSRIEEFLDRSHETWLGEEAWRRFQESDERAEVEEEFARSISGHAGSSNPYLRNLHEAHEREGLDNALVKASFKGYLAGRWKLADEISREEFMKCEHYAIGEDGASLFKDGQPVADLS